MKYYRGEKVSKILYFDPNIFLLDSDSSAIDIDRIDALVR